MGCGVQARAFALACAARGLAHRKLSRSELDIADPDAVAAAVAGLRPWTVVNAAAYGHVAFYREEDGVLITGDALLAVDLGSVGGFVKAIVRPRSARLTDPPRYLNLDHDAAVASAGALVRLRPRVLAPGHGRPLLGAALAANLEGYARTHGMR